MATIPWLTFEALYKHATKFTSKRCKPSSHRRRSNRSPMDSLVRFSRKYPDQFSGRSVSVRRRCGNSAVLFKGWYCDCDVVVQKCKEILTYREASSANAMDDDQLHSPPLQVFPHRGIFIPVWTTLGYPGPQWVPIIRPFNRGCQTSSHASRYPPRHPLTSALCRC